MATTNGNGALSKLDRELKVRDLIVIVFAVAIGYAKIQTDISGIAILMNERAKLTDERYQEQRTRFESIDKRIGETNAELRAFKDTIFQVRTRSEAARGQ